MKSNMPNKIPRRHLIEKIDTNEAISSENDDNEMRFTITGDRKYDSMQSEANKSN